MYAINTRDFPRGGLSSYADALKHYESRKPFRGTMWRPIGTRNCQNKAMHQGRDGSITFKLYSKECVVWHPDNSITVHGHSTMSTTNFVNALTPVGVSHAMGRSCCCAPVLHLHGEHPRYPKLSYGVPGYDAEEARYQAEIRAYWRSAQIIQCSRPVTLNYNVASKTWLPRDVDALKPFTCYRVDRKAARAVSREYHLPTLNKVLNAVEAMCAGMSGVGEGSMASIMECLKSEDYMSAVAMMPRGTSYSFGQTYGTRDGIKPGFLARLRDHIYEHEGVVERFELKVLSPSQYKRMVADSNRYS